MRCLTGDEMRELLQCCSPGGGRPLTAEPDQIIRTLSRLCGASAFGVVHTNHPRELLEVMAARLSLLSQDRRLRLTGSSTVFELLLLRYYLVRAWEAASAEKRAEFLQVMEEIDPAAASELASLGDLSGSLLDQWLASPASLRAGAAAAAGAGLALPAALATGPTVTVLPGVHRSMGGNEALYGVLLVVWRARLRLVSELSGRMAALEAELRTSSSQIERRRRTHTEQHESESMRPVSGAWAAGGAVAALLLSLGIGEPAVSLTALLLAAGCGAWSAAVRGRPAGHQRLATQERMLERRQRAAVRELQRRLAEISGDDARL